ncbi:MAG: signal peptidase II [Candidatus Kryptoniota bacterium]
MKVLYVTLSVVIADQVTKLFVRGCQIPFLGINIVGMPLYSSRSIIGNFLRFTYIENPGMAFGIDFGWKSFFAIFSIVASIAIFLYLYKVRQESRIIRFSLALILGGAIGNLIDRVFYGPLFDGMPLFHGRVVDFIDFDFFNISFSGYNFSRFPVFNLADASVTIGVVMLLIFHRKTMEAEDRDSRENDAGLVAEKLANDPPVEEPVRGEGSHGQAGETTGTTKG